MGYFLVLICSSYIVDVCIYSREVVPLVRVLVVFVRLIGLYR